MRIYGLDFTSAPTARKPITCARCSLQETTLIIEDCLDLPSLAAFEDLLRSNGPWLAALDFPFGQPRKLIENLIWPLSWQGYMSVIAGMTKQEFESAIEQYRNTRPAGDKQHLRATDMLAGARSPMMLHRVPVGKMFYQGATRLLVSPVSILPCRPTDDNRIVVEGYPALVARRLIGKHAYKSDERSKQSEEQAEIRREMVDSIRAGLLREPYGLTIELSKEMAQSLVGDAMGDRLDAVLCAVQAGWAYLERERGYGIPDVYDDLEGWIVDPSL
jgi:hypothetical protein